MITRRDLFRTLFTELDRNYSSLSRDVLQGLMDYLSEMNAFTNSKLDPAVDMAMWATHTYEVSTGSWNEKELTDLREAIKKCFPELEEKEPE